MRPTVAATIAIGVLAGCGASSATTPATTARSQLREDVLALSRAAAARNAPAAATALDNLEADLAAIRAGGQLNPTQVAHIRAAADAVRADLPTLTTPIPTPTSTPQPAKTKHHGPDNGKGNGQGDGKGKGH